MDNTTKIVKEIFFCDSRIGPKAKKQAISFLLVVSTVKGNRNQIWNSSGLSYVYTENQSSSSDVQKDS